MSAYPIGILASGTGSNFDAIAAAIEKGTLAAEIRLVVCNHRQARVLEKAEARGLPVQFIDHRAHASREEFDRVVTDWEVARGFERA